MTHIIYDLRSQKKSVAHLSVTRSLLFVEHRTGWNAKMCLKKNVVKSLTRSVNKYQGKNVKLRKNQNANKYVSQYIGVRFANCDWSQKILLYKITCVPFCVLRNFNYLSHCCIVHTFGDLKHLNMLFTYLLTSYV